MLDAALVVADAPLLEEALALELAVLLLLLLLPILGKESTAGITTGKGGGAIAFAFSAVGAWKLS